MVHVQSTPSGVLHVPNKPNAKRSAGRPARLASATECALAAKSAIGSTPARDGHGRRKSLSQRYKGPGRGCLPQRLHVRYPVICSIHFLGYRRIHSDSVATAVAKWIWTVVNVAIDWSQLRRGRV